MPEGEQGSDARRLEVAIPHEHALLVDDLPVDAGVPRRRAAGRPVLEPGGERDGQPARGLGRPHEDVRQRVGTLLAGIPRHEHGAGPLGPRHLDGRARVDHHHRPRVGGEDRLHELALATRQGEVGPVVPLGLPLPVGPDHDHGDVGRPRGGDRPLELVAGVGPRRADPGAQDGGGGRAGPHVHRQLVGTTGLEIARRLDGLAARAVEALAPRRLGVVDDDVAVHAQHGAPGALEAEPPPSRHVGREGPADADGAPPDGQARRRRADPHDACRVRHSGRRPVTPTADRPGRSTRSGTPRHRRRRRSIAGQTRGRSGTRPRTRRPRPGGARPARRPRCGAGAASPPSCPRPSPAGWRSGR